MPLYWKILGIVAIATLIIAVWRKKNATWGGLSLGVIIAIIVSVLNRFDWTVIKKILIVCTLVGAFFDMLGALSDYLRYRILFNKAKRQVDEEMKEKFPDLFK